jgi:multiple sugar transport system permease protein
MFLPAVLYVLLLVGVPFGMAFFYAFSDARIGSGGENFVGWENFSSILENPAFRTALKNSFIFTISSQILVIVGSTALALALKDKFRGRGFVRFLILLPWVAPFSLGAIGR